MSAVGAGADRIVRDARRVVENHGSSFARNVMALMERTEYRRCEKGEDLEDIYRLRYKAYRAIDMVQPNASRTVVDDLDDLANCYRFGIYVDGRLISTIRIHHLTAALPQSAAMRAFPDIMMPRLDAGDTFIDPSRFAVDPEWSRVYPQIPYITLRLAGMACIWFAAPFCLSTTREEHAGFYRRIYRSEQIGPPRDYPGLNYKYVLSQADVEAIRERSFARFPFFRSTPMEQRLLFSKPGPGELAPLTILPTAKYLKDAA